MNQRQAIRPQAADQAVDYGDVFGVTGATPSFPTPTGAVGESGITIGEALEATAISVGDKPVDRGDAAAIRAAEARAAGGNVTQRSGLGAKAQAAVNFNDRVAYDYNKITISDVLSCSNKVQTKLQLKPNPYPLPYVADVRIWRLDVTPDASAKLPHDKAVTSEDADGVRGAELSNSTEAMPTPGGVADTMATAARVNRDDKP
ncbi:hypothetical protein GOBAR_AA05400 [Gossypium barbadense]|uniref:SMP domain-containing protein n=1 Tax=Gossypium barbadense TaxID=3634 RepID=A0A2P5YHV0_GOSBA|nr:hypothetical protein GOBAR_AA05400 [Gossypium barbadense]